MVQDMDFFTMLDVAFVVCLAAATLVDSIKFEAGAPARARQPVRRRPRTA